MLPMLVRWWWLIVGLPLAGLCLAREAVRRSKPLQYAVDAMVLRLPVVGDFINRALVARWTRTLATLFGAGIPLVDALGSVAASVGNRVFHKATMQVQRDVSTGQRMTLAMEGAGVFPPASRPMKIPNRLRGLAAGGRCGVHRGQP